MEFIKTKDGRYIASYLVGRYGINTFFPKEEFLPFEEAREFIINLGIKSHRQWLKYRVTDKRPDNIPSHPDRTYKDQWNGWGRFLKTGNVFNRDIEFLSFEEARKIVRTQNLENLKEWQKYCKSEKRPENIPTNPNLVYKEEWIGLGDWLGTGVMASGKGRVFLSYREAKKFIRGLEIKNRKQWHEYCRSGEKPSNVPSGLNCVYKSE